MPKLEQLTIKVAEDLANERYEYPGHPYTVEDFSRIARFTLTLEETYGMEEGWAYIIALNMNSARGKLRLAADQILFDALEQPDQRQVLIEMDEADPDADASKNLGNIFDLFDLRLSHQQ